MPHNLSLEVAGRIDVWWERAKGDILGDPFVRLTDPFVRMAGAGLFQIGLPGAGPALDSYRAIAAAEQAMQTEGLMVDPVYTAKALALVSRYAGDGNVVFWHTGGQLDVVAQAAEALSAEVGR